MSAVWFRRFADIPGISYQTPPVVDLGRLRDRSAVPEVDRFGYGGLWWSKPDGGGTSASPAREHIVMAPDASTGQIRINIVETLELPGEPSDYHFALQGAADALYSRRRSDPSVFDDAHRLYRLDLDLIQAQPLTVTNEYSDGRPFYVVTGLARLLRLYLTEGRVADAAAIAEIAERFGAGDQPDAVAARTRAATLAGEDA